MIKYSLFIIITMLFVGCSSENCTYPKNWNQKNIKVTIDKDNRYKNGKLLNGLSLSLNNKDKPITISSDYNEFKDCRVIGYGNVNNNKIYFDLKIMSCCKDKYCYEFNLTKSLLFDNDNNSGLDAKHCPVSKKVKRTYEEKEEFLIKFPYLTPEIKNELLKIKLGKQGIWSLKRNTNVKILHFSQPKLKKKFLLNPTPLDIESYK